MMTDDYNMTNVSVKRDELLAAIRKNRETHRDFFLEAQKGYREAVIRELDIMLRDAREGRAIRRGLALVEPQEHTKDYDRVIRMLEMCTKDVVTISEQQFNQYVMDEWGWSAGFNTANSTYANRR